MASSELERELARALREAQSKYTYFLLAAAGTAIGFALTQTKEASLSWCQVPLGFGVVLWAVSFFCGCRHLVRVSAALYENLSLITIQADPRYSAAFGTELTENLKAEIAARLEFANALSDWQFYTLVGGAGFYIAWHIIEMSQRMPMPT